MEQSRDIIVEIVNLSAIAESAIVVVVLTAVAEDVQKGVAVFDEIIRKLHHYVYAGHLRSNIRV
jgi:hypothetical protein